MVARWFLGDATSNASIKLDRTNTNFNTTEKVLDIVVRIVSLPMTGGREGASSRIEPV